MTKTELLEIEMTCGLLRSLADRLQRAAKLMQASTALANAEAAMLRLAPTPTAAPPAAQREQPAEAPRVEVPRAAKARVSRVDTVERVPRGLAVFDVDVVEGSYRSRVFEVDFDGLRASKARR